MRVKPDSDDRPPPLFAAEDLTGKWSGSFYITMNGETKEDSAYVVLKQNGSELTGTAGPNSNQQWQILKGKVDGNKVTFEVQTDQPLIKFELMMVDGRLKGQANAELQGTARHGSNQRTDDQRRHQRRYWK